LQKYYFGNRSSAAFFSGTFATDRKCGDADEEQHFCKKLHLEVGLLKSCGYAVDEVLPFKLQNCDCGHFEVMYSSVNKINQKKTNL
jgi:hypothetical protein